MCNLKRLQVLRESIILVSFRFGSCGLDARFFQERRIGRIQWRTRLTLRSVKINLQIREEKIETDSALAFEKVAFCFSGLGPPELTKVEF